MYALECIFVKSATLLVIFALYYACYDYVSIIVLFFMFLNIRHIPALSVRAFKTKSTWYYTHVSTKST